jgi:sarcosine oxidase subunit alpha
MAASDLQVEGKPAPDWIAGLEAELASHPEVLVLKRAAPVGYYGDNLLLFNQQLQDHLPFGARDPLLPRQRLWRIRAREVVLATGAIERPLIFDGNDRPGVMLAGAVSTYVNRYGVLPGRNAVVFTNNNAGWQAAFDLHRSGGGIAAIADLRTEPEAAFRAWANERGIPVFVNSVIDGTSGRSRVNGVSIRSLTSDHAVAERAAEIACDLLAVSGGLSPNVALFSQSRGKLRHDAELAAFRPGQSWQRERSAGLCNGTFDLAERFAEGQRAGLDAAQAAGFTAPHTELPLIDRRSPPPPYANSSLGQLRR